MEIERIELINEIASTWCEIERFSGRLLLVDLGFDRETLIFNLGIFHICLDRKMRLLKASWVVYLFSQICGDNCKIFDALVFSSGSVRSKIESPKKEKILT